MDEKEKEEMKKRTEILKENGEENIDKIADILFRSMINKRLLKKKLK
ncbi:MAG: hypothetical protein ACRDAU_11260 [Clostridium sp.]